MLYSKYEGSRILLPARCKISSKGNMYVELHAPRWVPDKEGHLKEISQQLRHLFRGGLKNQNPLL